MLCISQYLVCVHSNLTVLLFSSACARVVTFNRQMKYVVLTASLISLEGQGISNSFIL